VRDAGRHRDAMRLRFIFSSFTLSLARASSRRRLPRANDARRMSRTRFRSDPTTRRGSRAGHEETSRANVVEGTRASMDFIRARANARDDDRVVARAGRGRRPRAGGVGGQRPRRRGSIRRRDRLDRYRLDRSIPNRLDRSIPIRSIDTDSIDRYRFDRRDAIGSISDSGVGLGGGLGRFPAHYGERARKG